MAKLEINTIMVVAQSLPPILGNSLLTKPNEQNKIMKYKRNL